MFNKFSEATGHYSFMGVCRPLTLIFLWPLPTGHLRMALLKGLSFGVLASWKRFAPWQIKRALKISPKIVSVEIRSDKQRGEELWKVM